MLCTRPTVECCGYCMEILTNMSKDDKIELFTEEELEQFRDIVQPVAEDLKARFNEAVVKPLPTELKLNLSLLKELGTWREAAKKYDSIQEMLTLLDEAIMDDEDCLIEDLRSLMRDINEDKG